MSPACHPPSTVIDTKILLIYKTDNMCELLLSSQNSIDELELIHTLEFILLKKTYEPGHEKICNLHLQKQKCRSAPLFLLHR